MNKKGFSLVELMGVIVILMVIVLLATSGYRLVSRKMKETSYDNKVSYIETKAVEYTNNTGYLLTNVEGLVKEGLILADDDEGHVINPIDGSYMNCHLVYVTEENGNFYGNYTEQEECNVDNLQTENMFLKINVYKTNDNQTLGEKVSTNTWTRENVILVAEIIDKNIDIESIEKIKWRSNVSEEERSIFNDFESKNKYLVRAEQIVNSTYSVEIVMKDGTIYQAESVVKIDKQRPIIYDNEIRVEKENEYTANDKLVSVHSSDGNGSGIYGYYIGEENNCNTVEYEEVDSNSFSTNKPEGSYYICVKDKAGNVSEDISTKKVEVKYIDSNPPIVKVKNNPLNLGTEDYEFKDNIEVTWGASGEGSISCDPTVSKKTGTYEVTCIVIGNNGLTEEVTFEVRHSYPATPIWGTCIEKSNCRIENGQTCECDYLFCEEGSGNCVTCNGSESLCCKSRDCVPWTHEVCDTSEYSCVKYYTCPQGGNPIDDICYY